MRRLLHRLRFRIDHRWTPAHASEYIDGECSPAERLRVERHIEECPECRELLRELNAVVGSLGGLRHEGGRLVAGSILASVRTRLEEAPGNSR